MAAVVVAATVVATTGLFGALSPSAQAASPDAGTANAYGANIQLLGGNVLGPLPSVSLGAQGQDSTLTTTLPLDVTGLLTANTLVATADSTAYGQAGEEITAAAGTEGIQGLAGISLLGPKNPLLDVQAINVSCISNAAGSAATTEVVGLSIDGAPDTQIPTNPAPNTGLTAAQLGPLAGLVTITLNKQTVVNRNTPGSSLDGTSVDVIGLQITLLGGVDGGAVINISHSFCQATGPDIEAVPNVTNVTPDFGPARGGTNVLITGSGFTAASDVTFGGVPATNVNLVTTSGVAPGTEITATSPAAADTTSNSVVPVQVTNVYGPGPSTATAANDFTYEVTPTLTSLTPTTGPTTGGQVVTLTGANFGPDTQVAFGIPGQSAVGTDPVVTSETSMTVVTPASPLTANQGAGVVDVTITDQGGTNTKDNAYTYVLAPIAVTSVVPDAGSTATATAVTITGTGFANPNENSTPDTVSFGGVAATNVVLVNGTTITADSPAPHAAGTVDVQVTNPSLNENPASLDTSFAVQADQFTYEVPPTISTSANGLNPNEGPVAGSTTVTITGTGFVAAPGSPVTVAFGANAATDVTVVSATELTAVSPASTLTGDGSGAVGVVVTDAGGSSNSVNFTYVAAPTITSVSPIAGPAAGGNTVTINGTNLGGTTEVAFGTSNVPAASITNVSATQVKVVAPAGVAGTTVAVSDTTVGGTGTLANAYTYEAPPSVGVNGLNPAYGPTTGNTTVTITGLNLLGVTSVVFNATSCPASGPVGGTPAAVQTSPANTATQVTIITPASPLAGDGAGPVSVCVTATGGTALSAEPFTYESAPPVINANGLSPTAGPVAGGTTVTITGSGFGVGDPNTTVTFGGAQGSLVDVISLTQLTVVTPPSPLAGDGAGPVNVVVTDSGGSATAAQQFTYVVAPTVTGISPTSGPPAGGETVTIKGTALNTATNVLFGTANAAIQGASADGTTLTVTEPPGTGTVPVFVYTPGGAAASPENFTYISPGYWEAATDGGVFAFGGAPYLGSVPGVLKPGQSLDSPIVAMADTPDHGGYWLFAADGGVFAFGDAPFLGSIPEVLAPGQKLNAPVVTAEATPDGDGYRMFAGDGGVFDFGDAAYEGGLPGLGIFPDSPVSGATAYPFAQAGILPFPGADTAGYWLVAQNGHVYPFGNAPTNIGNGEGQFFGKVVALATTPDGEGYYMFLQSGPVASFGDAVKVGSASNLSSPIVFGQSTSTGKGYWEFAGDGGVFSFGDAPYEGSLGGVHLNAPITAAIAFGSM
jgi:hypothetical protein